VGTEQIESALRACYPLAAVDRLDRDAAQRVGAQRRILHAWRAGDTDILVGTQMVSKGHDVPGVTLVAVLIADLSLKVPDCRAAERTLQLFVQVAGRAGRGAAPGRVVVQTIRPDHPSFAARMCASDARSHAWSAAPTRRYAERVSGSQFMWIRTPCYSSRTSPLLSWPCCASCSTPSLP